MKRLLLSLGCLVPILVAGLVPILALAEDPAFVPTGDAPFWQSVITLIGGIKGATLLAGSVLVCQAALALSQSVLGTFEGKYQYLAVCFFSLVVAVLGGLVSGQPFSAALLSGPVLAAFQVFGHQLYKQFFESASSAVTTALLVFAIVPLSLLAGCSSTGSLKPSCTMLDAVSSSVAAGISQPFILDCSQPEVLQAAIDAQAQSWGLCTAAPALAAKAPSARAMVTLPNGEQRLQGIVGSFICPELSSFVASKLVAGSTLLQQAGCKGTGFSNLGNVACSFVPF